MVPHDLRIEEVRCLDVRNGSNHRADRVTYEYDAAGSKFLDHFDRVISVTLQRSVPLPIVGPKVRTTGPGKVLQHGALSFGEVRRQQAPHRLLTAESMHENHRRRTLAKNGHVVTLGDAHRSGGVVLTGNDLWPSVASCAPAALHSPRQCGAAAQVLCRAG